MTSRVKVNPQNLSTVTDALSSLKTYMQASTLGMFCQDLGITQDIEALRKYQALVNIAQQLNVVDVSTIEVILSRYGKYVPQSVANQATVEESLNLLITRVAQNVDLSNSNNNSEAARTWAIIRTELQKVYAFLKVYVKQQ